MPVTPIPEFINYDTSVKTSTTGGPHVLSHARGTITADATWTGLQPVALGVGYARNHGGYVHRIYADTDEDVFTLTADAVDAALGQRSQRRPSSPIAPAPTWTKRRWCRLASSRSCRHYDVANRQRQQVHRAARPVPVGRVELQRQRRRRQRRLRRQLFRPAGVVVPGRRVSRSTSSSPNGIGAGASYTFERYAGFQRVAVGGLRRGIRRSRTRLDDRFHPRTCTTSRST